MRNNASIESGMKERILEARRKGLSYREIEKKLKCSKGLIAYHCSKGQKEKTLVCVSCGLLCIKLCSSGAIFNIQHVIFHFL